MDDGNETIYTYTDVGTDITDYIKRTYPDFKYEKQDGWLVNGYWETVKDMGKNRNGKPIKGLNWKDLKTDSAVEVNGQTAHVHAVHALQRAKERYNKVLDTTDLKEIQEACLSGKVKPLAIKNKFGKISSTIQKNKTGCYRINHKSTLYDVAIQCSIDSSYRVATFLPKPKDKNCMIIDSKDYNTILEDIKMNEIDKKVVLNELQDFSNNMTDEQAKKLYREVRIPREKLRDWLATMTISEIEAECQLSEQDIYYWVNYYKLNASIYDKRTYSGGLVPKNTEYTGWFNIKHKDELNKENGFVNDDEEQLLEQRLKDTEHDFQREMLKYNSLEARIKSLAQEIERLKILKKAYEEAKKNNDWLSYVEETRFGKRPEVKELSTELLTDEIVFDYLARKHGMKIIAPLLERTRDVQEC